MASERPTVSVVIPTFNRNRQLKGAVLSALRQDYPVHEVVIVDDGSDAPVTYDLLGTGDQRIRLLRLDRNSGPAAARQHGIDSASGDLIALLDSDDFWFPDKIAMQIKTLLAADPSQPVGVICGWQTRLRNRALELSRVPIAGDGICDFASGCWYCPGSTFLVRKEVFQRIGPFDADLRRLEDLEWFLRFALQGGRLLVAPTIGAYVEKSRNAKVAEVAAAVARILARFERDRHAALDLAARRRLRAWLHVEQAAAARNEGQVMAMALHLLRSLLLVPRTQVELKSWWTVQPPRWDHAQDPSECGLRRAS